LLTARPKAPTLRHGVKKMKKRVANGVLTTRKPRSVKNQNVIDIPVFRVTE